MTAPGDLSIQEIGITPDIQLIPTRVAKDRVDVFAPRRSMGEADLDHHFGNPSNDKAAKKREEVVVRDKPAMTMKYLKEEKEKVAIAPKPDEKDKKDPKGAPPKGKTPAPKNVLTDTEASPSEEDLDDQLDAESQDEVREDFEVTFARDFLLAAPAVRRDKMLEAGAKFVNDKSAQEETRIANAITALGVDWSAGETPKKVSIESSLKPNVERKIAAGETVQLELSAENKGPDTVKRLRAWIESENGYLDRREFLFGALKSGEKRSWTVNVKLPKDLMSRRDAVTVKFQDDSGGVLQESVAGELNFVELPRPRFAYSWQLVDDCQACNQDGQAQRGESVALLLDVTNVGTGKALDTFTIIRNAGDPSIFIEKGRFKLGELEVGETKTARFSLDVKKSLKADEFGLRINVLDEPLEEFLADKLVVPVPAEGSAPIVLEPRKGTVKVAERAEVYGSADPRSPVIARLPKGAVVAEQARGANMARVEWGEGRFAFVKVSDLRDARGQKPAPPKDKELEPVTWRAPAQISVNVDPAQGGTAVDSATFTLSSVITDPTLLDVYVLVNDQKVFFKGRTPDDGDKLKFTTEFPLKEGNNYVTIVARETQDFASRKTIVVRRRPPAVAQKVADEAPRQAKP